MMSVYCLGQETFEAEAVHVTKGAAETTAMCGYDSVNILTTGVDEDQYLCDDCADALDRTEVVPAFLTTMRLDEEEADDGASR